MPRLNLCCCASLCLLFFSVGSARADKLLLVAGGEGPEGSPAAETKLVQPFGVDFDRDGTMYIVEMRGGERLLATDSQGHLAAVAGVLGQYGYSGDGGPARAARFNGMHSLAVAGDGRVFLADTWNCCVRVFDPRTGVVSLFKGQPSPLPPGKDKAAPNAELGGVYSVAFDPSGQVLYLCDLDRRRIFRADPQSGAMSLLAGNGEKGRPLNARPAAEQPLFDPRAVAADRRGNVYILDRSANQMLVVSPDGKIRTVAGSGEKGAANIGGNAMHAQMNGPKHLAVDRDDSVLIADTENHRILRYNPADESLRLVAGTGKKGRTIVAGAPKQTELAQPHGVIVHRATGDIYIADSGNNRVLKIVRD